MMDEGKLPDKKATGSVKAAINSYRERILDENSTIIKEFQSIYPEKHNNKTRELHQAKRDTNQLKESQQLAELAKVEAESELSAAKKTVKDLTRKIEELNTRGKSQMLVLEKIKMDKSREVERDLGNFQREQVMKELQSIKRELNRLKLDMASILEEKNSAEKEMEAALSKAQSFLSSVEALDKEIEKVNEEHVLVELARIEAIKEYQEFQAQRSENAEKYSAAVDEKQKENHKMIQETESINDMEANLAITLSDINILESELRQLKKMDKGLESNKVLNYGEEPGNAASLLESVLKELETAKHELALAKKESFQFMASMDVIRNELRLISDQTAQEKKKEEETEMGIQNLNTKLLRAKSKLEIASASEAKAKSVALSLTVTLEQIKSEVETAKNQRSLIGKENTIIKAEIQRFETETEAVEEKLQSALQDLRAVKSSEAVAMENLKSLIEKTIRDRTSASQARPTITISKFEYDYLTGHAAVAHKVADRKVEAAQAWVEALKASEKEIQNKCELLKREIREMRVEELHKKAQSNEELANAEETVDEVDFEKWRQMVKPEYPKPRFGFSRKAINRRREKARESGSPVIRGTPRSTSFSVRRRTKVMPNLAKFFKSKGIEE
ncbi:Protein PLASTID MOVEMENT IMPAIRED 2 [Striga hermonthica]|uniref:Protein PLASTID MOVEMENT IMPAIRED 2 n=1 Tax=Striga hermonthica TaxID=68872 RepID=A0A9N7NP00_STRHE|nr:Protein PLASTID MOVEMENT IMPAIRED 2 [Striga hermonthica]